MTRSRDDIDIPVAFPPIDLSGTLLALISAAGLRPERIAETEKYAHLTCFFSGGQEAPYEGEARILVLSPRVATCDLAPQMSAREVTDAILAKVIERTSLEMMQRMERDHELPGPNRPGRERAKARAGGDSWKDELDETSKEVCFKALKQHLPRELRERYEVA